MRRSCTLQRRFQCYDVGLGFAEVSQKCSKLLSYRLVRGKHGLRWRRRRTDEVALNTAYTFADGRQRFKLAPRQSTIPVKSRAESRKLLFDGKKLGLQPRGSFGGTLPRCFQKAHFTVQFPVHTLGTAQSPHKRSRFLGEVFQGFFVSSG